MIIAVEIAGIVIAASLASFAVFSIAWRVTAARRYQLAPIPPTRRLRREQPFERRA